MMTIDSKALYLGNTKNEDCGFTVGKEYKIHDFGSGYIGVYDDNGYYRYIDNGAFQKFKTHDEHGYFVTKTECAVMLPGHDKKPEIRYYINGHEVDVIEFGNVRYAVNQLDEDGVKCDTIKFEVKFE